MFNKRKMTMKVARSLIGKKARFFGKHEVTITKVYRNNSGPVFFGKVNPEDEGDMIAFPDEVEVQATREIVLGYTLSVEEVLAASRAA